MKQKTVLAWHFSTGKLNYGDDRKISVSKKHSVKGEIVICNNGLHGSERIIDALGYARLDACIIARTEHSGNIIQESDKLVSRHRKYIHVIDGTEILREFARKQALINIKKIKPYCSQDSYSLILKWLKTGKEDLRSAARSAAWSAAESAARSAANEMLEKMVKDAMDIC